MTTNNAIFSDDRKYRYVLSRVWDDSKPAVLLIGLNPSTADETKNDPTIRRCIGFAQKWGFGSLYVCNLFAYRATYPQDLFKQEDPVGSENDEWIKKIQNEVDLVVLAYGNHGHYKSRHLEILRIINNPHCINTSKSAMPMHPLYLKYTENPVPYDINHQV